MLKCCITFNLILVGKTLKECHLPDFVRPYWKLIDLCLNNHTSQVWYEEKLKQKCQTIHLTQLHHLTQEPNPESGKVYFLTIEEGVPGSLSCGIHFVNQMDKCEVDEVHLNSLKRISQGKGPVGLGFTGGVFMASTVEGGMRVWDCSVDIDIPKGGDIEYLRWALPEESEEMR